MRILAVSGSLRAVSSNATLLRAADLIAPADVEIVLFDSLGDLPHFNPEQDGENPAPPIAFWRMALDAAAAVLICSPEYAHGVPGVLKNALDWVVGSGEFSGKPVGLLNASLQSFHAHASLTEILTTMDARVIADASPRIPITNKSLSAAQMAENPAITQPLRIALEALMKAVEH